MLRLLRHRTSRLHGWLVAALAAPVCACAVADIPSAPPHPTYTNDIHPYLADHCLVCHSFPSDRGAPHYFRLDVYADTGGLSGAATMARAIIGDVINHTPKPMPPGGGLGPNGKQMLVNWVADQWPE